MLRPTYLPPDPDIPIREQWNLLSAPDRMQYLLKHRYITKAQLEQEWIMAPPEDRGTDITNFLDSDYGWNLSMHLLDVAENHPTHGQTEVIYAITLTQRQRVERALDSLIALQPSESELAEMKKPEKPDESLNRRFLPSLARLAGSFRRRIREAVGAQ